MPLPCSALRRSAAVHILESTCSGGLLLRRGAETLDVLPFCSEPAGMLTAEMVTMQVSTDISGHCGYEGDRHTHAAMGWQTSLPSTTSLIRLSLPQCPAGSAPSSPLGLGPSLQVTKPVVHVSWLRLSDVTRAHGAFTASRFCELEESLHPPPGSPIQQVTGCLPTWSLCDCVCLWSS